MSDQRLPNNFPRIEVFLKLESVPESAKLRDQYPVKRQKPHKLISALGSTFLCLHLMIPEEEAKS